MGLVADDRPKILEAAHVALAVHVHMHAFGSSSRTTSRRCVCRAGRKLARFLVMCNVRRYNVVPRGIT